MGLLPSTLGEEFRPAGVVSFGFITAVVSTQTMSFCDPCGSSALDALRHWQTPEAEARAALA